MNENRIELEIEETRAWYLSWIRVPGFLIGLGVGFVIAAGLVWIF